MRLPETTAPTPAPRPVTPAEIVEEYLRLHMIPDPDAARQFCATACGVAAATTFTRRLAFSNCTWPSTSAKSVQSRPVPTFLPALNLEPT